MKLKKLLILLLAILLIVMLSVAVACELIMPDLPDNSGQPEQPVNPDLPTNPGEPEIVGISVFGAIEAYVDEFSYSDYSITVFYSDKTTDVVPLLASYLSADDQIKLTTIGTHTVTVTYEGVSTQFSVKLRYRGYDMSGIVFENATYTYDGQPHSLEVKGTLPGGVTVSYDGNAQTDAGVYTVTAKISGIDGEPLPNMTATLIIKKRELTVDFVGEALVEYDGNAHKDVTATATNLVDGDSVDILLAYSGDMVEMGDYTVTATIAEHANYTLTTNNTFKVTITRAIYTVTFKQDGQPDYIFKVAALAALSDEDIPTPAQLDTGYLYSWDLTGVDLSCITSDVTINAVRNAIVYTITYHLNDGFLDGRFPAYNPNVDTYTVEDSVTFADASRWYYTFNGWYTNSYFGTKANNIQAGSVGDVELYASWTAIEYSIYYYLNLGTSNVGNPQKYTVESAFEFAAPTRNYYDFAGWFTDSDFNTPITGIEQGSNGTISLYAKWTAIEYKIIYHLYGGQNSPDNPTTYTYETPTITLQAPLEREPYTFTGWFSYYTSSASVVTEIPKGSHGDIHVYGRWESNDGFKYYYRSDGNFVVTSYEGAETELTIPSTFLDGKVIGIDANAFENSNIISIVIPESILSIEDGAFKDCANLKTVYWNATNCTRAGGSLSKPIFSGSTNITTVVFGEGVRTIPHYTFNGCSGLTTITIPESVQLVGANAFRDCTSLATVYWNAIDCDFEGTPGSPTFSGCTSLTTIVLGEKVQTIPRYAFYGCSGLTSITIPQNVTSIGAKAFANCTNLTTIYWNATNCTKSISTTTDMIFVGCTSFTTVVVGANVQSFPIWTFYHCYSLNAVYITDLVAWCNIDFVDGTANPLYYAHNLYLNGQLVTNLKIPSEVVAIKSYTFNHATLQTVTFENNSQPQSIGKNAFYGCTDLTSIIIPSSVTLIGQNAFCDCSSLQSVYYCGTAEQWEDISIEIHENAYFKDATRYYYSATPETGKWHFDSDGKPTLWKEEELN